MKKLLYLLFISFVFTANAQENLNYQKPPAEILELVDVERAPGVMMDEDKEYMILLYRDAYKSIEVLSQEELRLGGLRIDPKTNIGSRTTYYNNIRIKQLKNKNNKIVDISGMPENPLFANLSYSPDQKMISLTHTTADGVELWVLDIENARLSRLTEPKINANMRGVSKWFEDGQSLLVKMVPSEFKE